MSTSTPSTNSKKGFSGRILDSLSSIYENRWLAWYMVQREISKGTKGSFLGFAWVFLTPFLMVGLYTLIFSEVIGLRFREIDSVTNFGLYLFCGLIPFMAYTDSVNQGVTSIRGNATLVQKLVFPTEILPMTPAVAALISQLFNLVALVTLTVAFGNSISWTIVLLPLIMIPQLLFMMGLAYLVAVVGTYLPDVRETLRALVRASFFATPIIWPPERAYEAGLGFLVDYNPLAILVEGYRNVVLDGQVPSLGFLGFVAFSVLLFALSFALFVKVKKNFGDLM
jgi:ABC-type polysaccharide/polyol phosphate export permease